jgi:hypothetical protein
VVLVVVLIHVVIATNARRNKDEAVDGSCEP